MKALFPTTGTCLLTASLLSVSLIVTGCASSGINPQATQVKAPATWHDASRALADIEPYWLDSLGDRQLQSLADEALANNWQLGAELARLEQARRAITIDGAARFPSFSAGLNARREKPQDTGGTISENYSAGLTLDWELDLWGKLSNRQKQAVLNYHSTRAQVLAAERQLVADVASAWYDLLQARALYDLYQQRLANLRLELDVIERGYRQGINEALDVYLSRDTVAQEESRTHSQRQVLFEASTNLQRLLSHYPDGTLPPELQNAVLPVISDQPPLGLPADLLARRPDIVAAWNDLLAADAALAIAHKERFPSLSLTASTSDSSDELHQLLDGGSLAWSLLGNLSQPLFAAGRLAAREQQAKARVAELEKIYLDTVFSAFADVENTISGESSLQARYQAALLSEQSATAAYDLSFEQYRRGLVSYTTVLEAQRRAFDAQTSVIQLRNSLVQNRIALHLALGGSFSPREQDL